MSLAPVAPSSDATDRTLLIVDDDRAFGQRLTRALQSRGYDVRYASSIAEGHDEVRKAPPAYAVFDLRLEDGSGMELVAALRTRRPDARAIVLTGYANIASAVHAVKLGVVDYLPKPADADDVLAALLQERGSKAAPPAHPLSPDQVKWEHVQRVFHLCDYNIAEASRLLNIHRRTLQRMLEKRAPRTLRIHPEKVAS